MRIINWVNGNWDEIDYEIQHFSTKYNLMIWYNGLWVLWKKSQKWNQIQITNEKTYLLLMGKALFLLEYKLETFENSGFIILLRMLCEELLEYDWSISDSWCLACPSIGFLQFSIDSSPLSMHSLALIRFFLLQRARMQSIMV